MSEASCRLTLSLDSRVEALDLLDEITAAWTAWLGAAEERRDQVVLAIREAAANAIIHGNSSQQDKKIEIELSGRNSQVRIRVKDEGEGFDPDSLPDPLLPENLLRQSGRGILLMKAYMDEVEFGFDGGTVAILRCSLGSGSADNKGEEKE